MESVKLENRTPDYNHTLENYHYNVVNIHPTLVDRDLMTDSWTELVSPVIDERMAWLQARVDYSDTTLHAAELFPFKHFLHVAQGRSAEAFFWRAAARKDKQVIQNLLFPTSRHHLVLNRMMPVECPVSDIFSNNPGRLFRGNLDCTRLRKLLENSNGDVAYIYIEAENNASGGYPVSMQNVREVHQLAKEHGVTMVLDATRLVENAVLVQRFEKGFSETPVRDIIHEFCSYFDAMTCSLAKDFGLTRGGFIATNNDKLFYRAQDYAATFGPGINATDRAVINTAIKHWEFIETMANRRIDQAARLHNAFTRRQLPLMAPASGHCLLIEAGDYIDLDRYKNPVTALLAWLFGETGVRGGLHVTGMTRDYARNSMVRFAIPLCTPDAVIDDLTGPFVSALGTIGEVPDLEKTSAMPGITGQMRANYRIADR